MEGHQAYMLRCVELAQKGLGKVAPNPMVGAVLVHEGRIIGEGWHQQFGKAHAEVNCINAVSKLNVHRIAEATLYVSLEPCVHFGKTPPCTALIIRNNIKRVVVGCKDPFKEVAGKGIQQLIDAGVEVIMGVEEEQCLGLNKRFFTFHEQQRPYIILKWAQTADHKMATLSKERLYISGSVTNQLVHSWRAQEQAILIGTNTALYDNPSLTVRLADGNNPIRLVIDTSLKLPTTHHLFTDEQKTVVYNYKKNEQVGAIDYVQLDPQQQLLEAILSDCYHKGIQSILVEGGAHTIQQFIDHNLWDEARVIENTVLTVGDGLVAPILSNQQLIGNSKNGDDLIYFYSSTTKK